jgi:hypothetical protein
MDRQRWDHYQAFVSTKVCVKGPEEARHETFIRRWIVMASEHRRLVHRVLSTGVRNSVFWTIIDERSRLMSHEVAS